MNKSLLRRLMEAEKKLGAQESRELAKQKEQIDLSKLSENDQKTVLKADEILSHLEKVDLQQLSKSDQQIVLKAEEILTQAELKETRKAPLVQEDFEYMNRSGKN